MKPIKVTLNFPEWKDDEIIPPCLLLVKIDYVEKKKGKRVIHKGEVTGIIKFEENLIEIMEKNSNET